MAVTRAMGQLARLGGVQVDVTSHCGRVGTCTALMQLGMPLELLNAHVGWGHRSEAAVCIYNRPGTQLAEFDGQFFYAALPLFQQRLI